MPDRENPDTDDFSIDELLDAELAAAAEPAPLPPSDSVVFEVLDDEILSVPAPSRSASTSSVPPPPPPRSHAARTAGSSAPPPPIPPAPAVPRSAPPSSIPPPLPANATDGRAGDVHTVVTAPPEQSEPGAHSPPSPRGAVMWSTPPNLRGSIRPVPGKGAGLRAPTKRKLELRPSSIPPPPLDESSAKDPREDARALVNAARRELTKKHPAPPRASRLHFEIATALERVLSDRSAALKHYEHVRELNPEHLAATRGARRVRMAEGDVLGALPLFDEEIRLSPATGRKSILHYLKGQALESLGDMSKAPLARTEYWSALELDKGNGLALEALVRIARGAKDWQELDALLERQANLVSNDPRLRAELVLDRARLREARLDDEEGAVELYEKVLELDPSSTGAMTALARLHRTRNRWRDLIRLADARASVTESKGQRAQELCDIGDIQIDQLGNTSEALDAYEAALALDPSCARALDRLQQLYLDESRFEDAINVLSRSIDQSRIEAEQLELMERAARIAWESLGDPGVAIEWYSRVLEIDAGNAQAVRAVSEIYASEQRWDALLGVLDAAAGASTESDERAHLFYQMARLYDLELHEPGRAAEFYEKCLAQSSNHEPSMKALIRIYSDMGSWGELVELLERSLGDTPTTEKKTSLLLRIGMIHEDATRDASLALDAYKRALNLAPNDHAALSGVQRAATRAGRFDEVVKALELEANVSDRRAHLLTEVATIRESKLNDSEGAVATLREVLEQEPSFEPAFIAIETLLQRLGRWNELVDVLTKRLDTVNEPSLKSRIHLEIAEILEIRLGRERDALEYFKSAVELDEGNGKARSALAYRLRKTKDWLGLEQLLEAKFEQLERWDDKAKVAVDLARLAFEHGNRPDASVAWYQRALEFAPLDEKALRGAVLVLTAQGRWAELVTVLRTALESSPSEGLAARLWKALGNVLDYRIADTAGAIECFERVIAFAPSDVGALLRLRDLHHVAENQEDQRRLQELLAFTLSDPASQIPAMHRLAQLASDGAKPIMERVLEMGATDMATLELLDAIAVREEDLELLVKLDRIFVDREEDPITRANHLARLGTTLELQAIENEEDATATVESVDAFRTALELDPESFSATRGLSRAAARESNPELQAEAARREASIAPDAPAASESLVESGRVRYEELGDDDGAQTDFERALELDPDNENAATGLQALLLGQNEPKRATELLTRAANAAKAPERQASLWHDVAKIQLTLLESREVAIASLQRALKCNPKQVESHVLLGQLLEADGQAKNAAASFSKAISSGAAGTELMTCHLALARVWSDKLGDHDRALVSLTAITAINPDHREANERKCDILEAKGNLREAEHSATALLRSSRTNKERSSTHIRIARLKDQVGDPDGAIEHLIKAVAVDGPSGEAGLDLKSRLTTVQQWRAYVEAVEAYLLAAGPDAESAPIYADVSRVWHDQLGNAAECIQTLRRGLVVFPDAVALRTELASRLRAAGEREAAVQECLTLLRDQPTNARIWRQVAQIRGADGNVLRSRIGLDPLQVLEDLKDDDKATVGLAPPQPLALAAGTLNRELICTLFPQREANAAALAIVQLLAPSMAKLFPRDLDAYGLAPRDRESRKDPTPIRLTADRVAQIVGCPEFDLYLHRVRTKGVAMEFHNPNAVLIPAALLDMAPAHQTFLLARPLIAMAAGVELLQRLTPREVQVYVAAAVRMFAPQFGAGLTSEDELETLQKRIHKAIPRRDRKAMAQHAEKLRDLPRFEYAAWIRTIDDRILQLAAILSDDLPGSVGLIQRLERELAGKLGPALVEKSPLIADLMRFWVSTPAMEMRARGGYFVDKEPLA